MSPHEIGNTALALKDEERGIEVPASLDEGSASSLVELAIREKVPGNTGPTIGAVIPQLPATPEGPLSPWTPGLDRGQRRGGRAGRALHRGRSSAKTAARSAASRSRSVWS